MNEWLQLHSLVEIAGFIISGFAFAGSISARLTKLETKIDLLMEGRELVKVRSAKDAG